MANFSIGTAIGSGFSLIKRRPLSVFVWGLLMILPAAAGMAMAVPMMGGFLETATRGDGDGSPFSNPMMGEMMQFQGVMGLLNLVRFVLGVVIYTAVVRAVVRPKETSFFSLRLGMDELRVFVVSLVMVIGIVVAVLLVTLLGVAIGASVWQSVGAARGLIVAVLVIGGIVGGLALGGRLSLLVPATVRFRTFAFAEGWKLGKGRTWALVGMLLLLFLMVIGFEIVIGIILMTTLFASGVASGFDPETFASGGNPFASMTQMAQANWPWLIVGGLVASMVYGMLTVILTAPFASAVRQLSPDPNTADVF